jgi:TetR/AcrR family transcriptional regulator
VTAQPARLPAPERRQALVDVATRLFAARGYRSVTTADIAREAGVSEPILYRHFASKRDLYVACLDESQRHLRRKWEQAIAATPDPGDWIIAIGRAMIAFHRRRVGPPALWIQALTEAADDPELAKHVRRYMREAHDFVADVLRRAQELGGIEPDRDPDAEAWIFVGVGMVATTSKRLGGVLTEEDLTKIASSRSRWLTGRG